MQESKKNILLLTNIYPSDDGQKGATPVVHYFTREWVKIGYNVKVAYYVSRYPKILCWAIKLFRSQLSSKLGFTVMDGDRQEIEYEQEGVKVNRIALKKTKPHSLYKESELQKAYQKTIQWCESQNYRPDVIISHWQNPMLDIMSRLKAVYNAKTCYVAHSATEINVYGDKVDVLLKSIDVIGFRSDFIKERFLKTHNFSGKTFLCYSGIPEQYLPEEGYKKTFGKRNSFVYVGTLIERKFPAVIVPAVKIAFGDDDFSIKYIGSGAQDAIIKKAAQDCGVENSVHLLGRIPRDQVVQELRKNEIFVMISRSETFGLVYLETMAMGCITVASRGEGFDGIIKDGVNGFLCEAGNVAELVSIINKIRNLSKDEIQSISGKAMETARELTDVKAAKYYIENVIND